MSGDARLARIMQEHERLEAMMRSEQKRIRRAQRERQQREQRILVSLVLITLHHFAPCGAGTALFPLSIHFLIFCPFYTFLFLSLALLIFFFRLSLPFLPE